MKGYSAVEADKIFRYSCFVFSMEHSLHNVVLYLGKFIRTEYKKIIKMIIINTKTSETLLLSGGSCYDEEFDLEVLRT